MTLFCESCSTRMPADAPSYMRLCRPCYAASKRRETADLHDEIVRLRGEVARLRLQAPAVAAAALEPTMLRRLLQLCHPDKHGGSTMAGEVTAWLLALRERATQ
jgi:hypothetical protein